MQNTFSEVTLTIFITTLLLVGLGGLFLYYIFLYQGKKYRHWQELAELRETFGKTLLQSKLEIQEQTLDHIAKEIHANLSHIVSVININLTTLSFQKPDEMREKISDTKLLAKQLMVELKSLSISLNTDHIMQTGFVKSLENELNRLDRTGEYYTTLTKKGHDFFLKPENEIILFRMFQEILNNIVKHSEAKSIVVSLEYFPGMLVMTVEDNGKGFDVHQVTTRNKGEGSTGIRNIYNRGKLIGASVDIDSHPGKGTVVRVSIPANEQL